MAVGECELVTFCQGQRIRRHTASLAGSATRHFLKAAAESRRVRVPRLLEASAMLQTASN